MTTPREIPAVYLGDGVYVSFDGFQLWLIAESYRIALEPAVLANLIGYAKKINENFGVQHFDLEGKVP